MEKLKNQQENRQQSNGIKVRIFIFGGVGLIVLLLILILGWAVLLLIPTQETTNKEIDSGNKTVTINQEEGYVNSLVTKAFQRQKIIHPPVSFIDPQLGAQNAPITIIEYSDFNCLYCAEVQSTLSELFIRYPDKIKLVWKSLPIKQLYPTSESAAMAALCAGEQDKFWEYHDLLFANQGNFSKDAFIGFAKELDLNTENFSKCLENETMLPRVKKTMQEAEDLNITGTPHFYINQQEIVGAADLDEFIDIVDIELGE